MLCMDPILPVVYHSQLHTEAEYFIEHYRDTEE